MVWQIIEQNDSVLWVSTDYGVNRWKRSTQQFTPYYLGTQNNPPKQEKSFLLDITSGKYIICYVKEQGLFYFDDRKQDFVPLKIICLMASKTSLLMPKTKYSSSQNMDNYYIINYLSIALISNSRSKRNQTTCFHFQHLSFSRLSYH